MISEFECGRLPSTASLISSPSTSSASSFSPNLLVPSNDEMLRRRLLSLTAAKLSSATDSCTRRHNRKDIDLRRTLLLKSVVSGFLGHSREWMQDVVHGIAGTEDDMQDEYVEEESFLGLNKLGLCDVAGIDVDSVKSVMPSDDMDFLMMDHRSLRHTVRGTTTIRIQDEDWRDDIMSVSSEQHVPTCDIGKYDFMWMDDESVLEQCIIMVDSQSHDTLQEHVFESNYSIDMNDESEPEDNEAVVQECFDLPICEWEMNHWKTSVECKPLATLLHKSSNYTTVHAFSEGAVYCTPQYFI